MMSSDDFFIFDSDSAATISFQEKFGKYPNNRGIATPVCGLVRNDTGDGIAANFQCFTTKKDICQQISRCFGIS